MQLQPILGVFDTIAEAQQAVQLLLARGFTNKNVKLSTRLSPMMTHIDSSSITSSEYNTSGRFFSSLFESHAEVRSRNNILVTVQTQSATEAKQVTELLNTAGAGMLTRLY